MRQLDDIDQEIAAVSARLADLEIERRTAREKQVKTVVEMFESGASHASIARQLGMSKAAVIGILWRNGRTVAGREERRRNGCNITERLDRSLSSSLRRG